MVLFMIGAFPAFIVWVFLSTDFGRRLFEGYRKDFLKGLIVYLVAMLIYYIVWRGFDCTYSFWGIVCSSFFGNFFLPFAVGVIGYIIFYRNQGLLSGSLYERCTAYFAGFYTLSGLFDFIIWFGGFDFYNLFMLPLARISAFIMIPLLVEQAADEIGWQRVFFLLACIAVFGVCAFLFYFYIANMLVLFYILSLLVVAGSGYLFYRRVNFHS